MSPVLNPVSPYTEAFARLAARPGASEPSWLSSTRRQAFEAFEQRGFPTTRDEEWRYTSVSPIIESEFAAAETLSAVDAGLVDASRLPGAAATLVFVNGVFAPALSNQAGLADGVQVERLSDAVRRDASALEPHLARVAAFELQPFVALNTALWTDGVVVRAARRVVLEVPIHLIFVSAPVEGDRRPPVSHPRVLVVADVQSQVSIVETYLGAEGSRYLTNSVTEAVVAEQAVVNHYTMQQEGDAAFHVSTIQATLQAGASFNAYSLSFGGALVRNDVVVAFRGEGGQSTLNGLYMADRSRLVDNHTTIDHAKAHCDSREVYKGVLSDRAHAVFNGKIMVRPDAQKTDAKQTNKALLLSDTAQVNTKPQLEIYANDVKCTHGAAVGQMDEDALFYLRARGLPIDEARRLLIQAFAGDVLFHLPLASVRALADAELMRRLARAGAGA